MPCMLQHLGVVVAVLARTHVVSFFASHRCRPVVVIRGPLSEPTGKHYLALKAKTLCTIYLRTTVAVVALYFPVS